jgi:hypothetical protein
MLSSLLHCVCYLLSPVLHKTEKQSSLTISPVIVTDITITTKWHWDRVFSEYITFVSTLSIIPTMFHTHISFIYRPRYIILAKDSVVNKNFSLLITYYYYYYYYTLHVNGNS